MAGAACIGEWRISVSWFWFGEFDVVCSTCSKWFENDSISFKFKLFSQSNSSISIFSTLKLFPFVGLRLFSLCNDVVVAPVVDDDWPLFALYNWSLSHKFGPRNADEFQATFDAKSLDNNCLSDFTKQNNFYAFFLK